LDKNSIKDIYHLSPLQRGMLFHAMTDESTGAYIQQVTLSLDGEPDIALLQESFNQVISHYDVLKTMFIYKQVKEPVQLVLRQRQTGIDFEDISTLREREQKEYLDTFMRKDKERGFDLSKEILLRLSLFKLAQNSYKAILTFHHIIMDGWSLGIVINALLENYRSLQIKEPLTAPATKAYSEFIHWIERQDQDEGLAYWQNYLAGYEQKAEIPSWKTKIDADSDYIPGQTSFTVNKTLVNKLRKWAQQKGVTLNTIVRMAWGVLLHKYNNSADVVFGAVVSGRSSEIEGIESMVGLFINTIPVRMQFDHNCSCNELIEAIQASAFESAKYDYLPLTKIQANTELKRDLINHVLVYENFPIETKSREKSESKPENKLNVTDFELAEQTNYNFNIYVTPGVAMTVKITYNANIYEEAQVRQLTGHFTKILQQMADNPEIGIAEIEILSDAEKAQLLTAFNNTETLYPKDKTVCQLFEAEVEKAPDRVAAVFESEQLTYRQLNQRVNQVARVLRKNGVSSGSIVGIMVERSLEMIVGMLGILKAGGAYLPIGPDYPEERIGYMLEDSKAKLLLTDAAMARRIDFQGRKLLIDDAGLFGEAVENPDITVNSEDLAYVMYTSGTTGKPKGVMIPHRALVNFLLAMGDRPGIQRNDQLLAVTTYCFDIAGLELFLPLINGAQCRICSAEKVKDVEKLKQEIKRVKPTLMQATPVTWTMLFQAGWNNEEKLKILCGGEALPERLKQYFIDSGSEAWNMFGPTETTIWSTTQPVKANEPITIGKPIANTQIYILDRDQNLAPVGILGELHIGGDGLAKGYLNKPELTAARFISSPFAAAAKIYKTGDLARWLPDGTVEFLGRIDHQVKIRGFRIELGEIESQLNSYPAIKDSVVVVKEDAGIKQLIAYFVRKGQALSDAGELDAKILREHLQATLPGYMIPAVFVELEAIPLTSNEKVDRKELMNRKIAFVRPPKESLPESDIEAKILEIWKEVLHIENISTEEGFYEVGGDSFSAVSVAEKIENTLGCDFNVTALFKYSSVKEIGKYITELKLRESAAEGETAREPLGLSAGTARAAEPGERQTGSYPEYYQDSIALIGISCQFPDAQNPDEFWENIRGGKESFRFFSETEMAERNLPAELRDDPNFVAVNSVIEGKDLFDPEFFNLSYRDAELMDPQLRLLLLHSWKAMEDAGYVSKQIPDTGVFMSAGNNFYQSLALSGGHASTPVMRDIEQYLAWMLAQGGTIPTMISHKLGLKGPSLYIHSNCSSSLAGVHSAYQSLIAGETNYALVGGASLHSVSNLGYLHQNGLHFSGDGHVKAFDASADGMMSGEGVIVILLKRALDAVEAGDHIYALLRGIGINNDGSDKVGFYAPSVKGQAEVVQKVLDATGVNPESISYIEAHGTGTKLGDAIEFAALHEVYSKYSDRKQFCGLGSVKTNIGHLDSAAGLAGLIKVALSLHHNEIPPSLNYKEPNPNFKIGDSPFYIVDKLTKWESNPIPRRAALSSFGIGGTNTHAILEQYPPDHAAQKSNAGDEPQGALAVPLSAKNHDRLKAYAKELSLFLNNPVNQAEVALADVAYTLQVGREAMDSRAVFIVNTIAELRQKLDQFVSGKDNIEDCFKGEAQPAKDLVQLYENDPDHREIIANWIAKHKVKEIGKLWAKGLSFDWNKLYGETRPRRISLPTYQFSLERYWISTATPEISNIGVNTPSLIHPLLHRNTSDFEEQRYSSVFSGKEFFLSDHVVNGRKVLPGVAYLEMARAAVERAVGNSGEKQIGIRLKNVVWVRPISVAEQPVQVHIGLYPEENGEINYEIYSESEETGSDPVAHSQGSAVLSRIDAAPVLDLPALQGRCNHKVLSSDQCYEAFKMTGIDYGPGHKGVEAVYIGADQVLAKLSLPAAVSGTQDQFILHPSLMDAAVQATIGLYTGDTDGEASLKPSLPFALGELEILSGCTPTMWALIRYSGDRTPGDRVRKMDIELCDDRGRICIRMKEFTSRFLEDGTDAAELETLMLEPSWREQPVSDEHQAPDYARRLVILCEQENLSPENLTAGLNQVSCLALQSSHSEVGERFQTYAVRVFEEIKAILRDKPKGRILVQIVVPAPNQQRLFSGLSGLSGLLKTAQLENPKFIGQLIMAEAGQESRTTLEQLEECGRRPGDQQVRYQDGKRWVADLSEMKVSLETGELPWKDRGVYLISGGAGGLGRIFAGEIAQTVKDATLILIGRSALGEELQAQLHALESSGVRISYHQVDVSDQKAVAGLIQKILREYGHLDGIIHAAGVIEDNFIIKKTKEEFLTVLAPKVNGLVNLDRASQDLKMDCFILFSSIGSFGNAGQADYAAANAFMDAYAGYRNNLAVEGRRHGRTFCINWPLWQEGGMRIAAETQRMMSREIGMAPLRTQTGIQALYRGMASGATQAMVVEGNPARLRQKLLAAAKPVASQPEATMMKPAEPAVAVKADLPGKTQDMLEEKAVNYFKKLLSSVIKLPPHRIEAEAPMEKYGIDSIMVTQLTNQLETVFGSLSKTLFFEYQNIKELTGYFLESYRDQLTGLLGMENEAAVTRTPQDSLSGPEPQVENALFSRKRRSRFRSLRPDSEPRQAKEKAFPDIAIIGVSGRYPGARDVREFWENLKNGKDCITEIPKDRWDHSMYFDADKSRIGKTYSKWGGFIEGVDRFDPLFFNISPRDARLLDPQERLFLQCVYETIEDAGYTREELGKYQGFGLEGNVGVYVGVMYEEYQLYGAQEQTKGRNIALTGSASSVANRVSWFCNFHGPSIGLDTMCSSSLTAIHLACHSLQRDECQVAIAGGVNVSVHPNKYLMLGQGKFVSSKGRCESFGEGGDGYVPGEGVGAVLLKPLAKAVADGDHIYGVIKATALNHGGKTNGYSVPNPNAQTSVIGAALKRAGINPRTLSYIEAHGTGTILGDPIEITGLTRAFQEYTKDKQFCAIGSAKSNIGHCESAAGIAAVTKVLLQLKHGQLAPSLHSETLNPNIDFANSPFVVQQELAEWKRPVVTLDGGTREYPRIAGISSFGAGGANAHVVIEEYVPERQKTEIAVSSAKPALIVLSAKNEERLKEYARQLLRTIKTQQFSAGELADIAFTLQVGREAMEERLATTAVSLRELEEKLQNYLDGQDNIDDLYRGQIKRNKEMLAVFTNDEDMEKTIDAWIVKGKYAKLLELWVKGYVLDWQKLYDNIRPNRVSLPTYPFSGERYWYTDLFEREPVSQKETTVPSEDAPPKPPLSRGVSEAGIGEKPAVFLRSAQPGAPGLQSPPQERTGAAKPVSAKPAGLVLGSPTNGRTITGKPLSGKPTEVSLRSLVSGQVNPGKPAIVPKPDQISLGTLPDNPTAKKTGDQVQVLIDETPPSVPLSSVNGSASQTGARTTDFRPHGQPGVTLEAIQEDLAASLAEALYMKRSEVDDDAKFMDMGMDSIIGVAWVQGVNQRYGTSVAATKVYDYPTISEFAEFLERELKLSGSQVQAVPTALEATPTEDQARLNPAQPSASGESGPEEEVTVMPEILPDESAVGLAEAPVTTDLSLESIREELVVRLAEALYMKPGEVDIDTQFMDMGMDSIIGVAWVQEINKRYGTSIAATKVYDYPTISEFAGFVKQELKSNPNDLEQTPANPDPELSLQDVLQKVGEGTLSLDEADQLINQYNLKE
jgi:amino acid adenylation domain-containing protein